MNLEELERRVTAIEDLEEIKKLHQKYMNLMDKLKYKEVVDLYVEDATVEVRNSGVLKVKEGLTEIYINKLGKRTARSEGHFVVENRTLPSMETPPGEPCLFMCCFPNRLWTGCRE